MPAELSNSDLIIISAYFVLILGVAFYFSGRQKRNLDDYFLGGRNSNWFILGFALIATNMDNAGLVGIAQSGNKEGIGIVLSYEMIGVLFCLILSFVFIPYYVDNKIFTTPEYIRRRFNDTTARILSNFSLIVYILTKISSVLLVGATLLQYLLGIDFYTACLSIVGFTALYTAIGGLKGVLYTEVIQAFFIFGGAILLTIYSVSEAGGWSEVFSYEPAKDNPYFWDMIRPASDKNLPWTAVFLGIPITALWWHCTDQYMVQKLLTAKNIQHARAGSIFSGFLKLALIGFVLLPGIAGAVCLANNKFGLNINPHETEPLKIYHILIVKALPAGVKGLVLTGFLAALMSSLASTFSSISSIFTLDIYRRMFPNVKEFRLINIGKVAIFASVIFGMVWVVVLVIDNKEVYDKIQGSIAFLVAPISAVYLLGIVSKKITSYAAISGLIFGIICGIRKMSLSFMHTDKTITNGTDFAQWLYDIQPLHFCAWIFLFCCVFMIAISVIQNRTTSRETGKDFTSLTIFTPSNELKETLSLAKSVTFKRHLIFAAILVAIVVVCFIILS